MDTLKNYRENEIKWYILTFLLIAIGVYGTEFFQTTISPEDTLNYGNLVITVTFSGAICTLAFVADSLYTSKMKECLVFFKKKKIPGASIFSRIKNKKLKDVRLDIDEALIKYQGIIMNLPEHNKAEYENSQWYKIYNKYKTEGAVISTHRDFLLCRDLYITTISIILLSTIGMISQLIKPSGILLIYLSVMLVFTNFSARNKAHRFVNTVITIDMATDDKE